jgi:glycosyltransferase involved in cell wall biosynthesis
MKILFVSDMTVSSVIRQQMPGEAIFRLFDHTVSMANVFDLRDDILTGHDVYCFIRPTVGVEKVMDYIRTKINPKAFFVVDQDDCFDLIPKHHVAYQYLGKGNPQQEGATKSAMMRADVVTVSTPQLAEYYRQFNPRVLPNGWSTRNPKWQIENKNQGIVIGWAGTVTHREDFKMVSEALLRLTREFSQVQILIGVDEKIFDLFRKVSSDRKAFIPMLPYNSYPGLVKQFHILLAPLQVDPFNRFKSDIKLVEAGAARVPFIASPTENYLAWGVGGLFASTPEEYYSHLKQLILEPETRQALADAGAVKAATREIDVIVAQVWSEILQEAEKKWA